MPRSFGSTRPTMPLPDIGGDRGAAGLQVVAQPSDPVGVMARPADQGSELAQALASLNPGIHHLLSQQSDENAKAQFELGARDRMMQEDNAPVAMTPEQNPYWQQGYMKQHGVLAGQQAVQQMKDDFAEQHTQPGFNPDQFFTAHAQAQLAGMSDKDALGTMLPQMDRAKGELTAAWGQYNLSKIREGREAGLLQDASGTRQQISSETDPAVQRSLYEEYLSRTTQDGHMTKPEAARALVTDYLANASSLKPEAWDWMRRVDETGTSVAMVSSGKEGVSLDNEIARGQAESIRAQHEAMKAAATAHNIQDSAVYANLLETNPLALGDATKYVLDRAGPLGRYDTPEKVEG